MARKISGGLVGEPSVGAINIAPTAVLTTALNQDIGFANNIILNAQNDIRFADADSSNWVAFQAPSTISSDVTWTLPSADGTSNQVLTTNGSGTLTWTSPAINLVDNIIDATTHFVTFTATSTNSPISELRRSSTGMTFQPSTGTLTVTNFVESSSIALKENVQPITNALDLILQLDGVTYDRKDGSSNSEPGLIAEWVERILPELVTKDANGHAMGVKYTKLTAYLIESIKSLKAEIEQLKGR
jgi:hypothetical protein